MSEDGLGAADDSVGEGSAVPTLARPPGDVPPEWAALMRLAARIHATSMVPKPLRGRPDETLAVMLHGVELGLPPITALRSIHVIEGQPTASAQLMRALILQHGHLLQWRVVSGDRVVLYGRRRDTGSDAMVEWTIEDARRAKLLGRGNWATYPRAMLAARATSELARLLFADLLHGLAYTPDEVSPGYIPGPIEVEGWSQPAAREAAEMLDVEDELDREWLRAARGEPAPEGEPEELEEPDD